MPRTEIPVQYLLTLPPRMVSEFEALAGGRRPEWFATSDPPSQPLGSGGGTANLLAEAWRATAPGGPFDAWLRQSRKLILHAGGYPLPFGKDESAAARIKQVLTNHPPNARARFVDFSLSQTGLQLTRS